VNKFFFMKDLLGLCTAARGLNVFSIIILRKGSYDESVEINILVKEDTGAIE
jgi:hypothetical protein